MDRKRLTLRNVVVMAICLAGISFFTSCDEQNDEQKSSEKQITAFVFTSPSATGVIDEMAKTITVEVSAGTTLTALVPTITVSEKARVNPASGVAQNFTSTVTYTVTAEDGTTAEYRVTVSSPVIIDDRDYVWINGVKWAKYNVGAPGSFANDITAVGMYYQWSHNIGWKEDWQGFIRNSNDGYDNEFDFTNPPGLKAPVGNGATWAPSQDPSPKDYRIPTDAEFQTLFTELFVTREYTTMRDPSGVFVNGWKFTDRRTGAFIFLRLAGVIALDKVVNDKNRSGLYWSNFSPDYGDDTTKAVDLHLISTDARLYKVDRRYGCTIRPVHNVSVEGQ